MPRVQEHNQVWDYGPGSFFWTPAFARDKGKGWHLLGVNVEADGMAKGAVHWLHVSENPAKANYMGKVYTWNGDLDRPTLKEEFVHLGTDRGWDNPESRWRLIDGELVKQ